MYRDGVQHLLDQGHEVRTSDLYAMKFDTVVRTGDFSHADGERLVVGSVAQHAFEQGTLSPDISAEHDKLSWADTLVVQFPLWWYGMPAILKGWFDRVFVGGNGGDYDEDLVLRPELSPHATGNAAHYRTDSR
ncbi:NAD(P)H-dependent oxidoreductase [Streptomyces sp. NPDC004682]